MFEHNVYGLVIILLRKLFLVGGMRVGPENENVVLRLKEDWLGWRRLRRSAVPTQKFFPAPIIKTRHRLPGKTFI